MGYYANLQKTIDYIEDNLEVNVRLEQIAKIAGYSIPHLYRIFVPTVGCPVREYIKKRKLNRAVLDLATTERSIAEIAFKYGFESHEVFTRNFKSVYGLTPSSFRRTYIESAIFRKSNV